MDKYGDISDEEKHELQDRISAMKEKRASNDGERNSQREQFADMTTEERDAEIKQIREDRKAQRESQQNMTDDEKLAYLEEQRDRSREARANSVSLNQQIGIGADPQDIVCPEGKELVIKISDGLPKCLSSNGALMLIDRGVVAYPEDI